MLGFWSGCIISVTDDTGEKFILETKENSGGSERLLQVTIVDGKWEAKWAGIVSIPIKRVIKMRVCWDEVWVANET